MAVLFFLEYNFNSFIPGVVNADGEGTASAEYFALESSDPITFQSDIADSKSGDTITIGVKGKYGNVSDHLVITECVCRYLTT